MQAPWRIQLLGGLRATQGKQALAQFRTQKTGLLLAYLAYYPGRAHRREELIELLWPECEPKAGRNNLRVALSALRSRLEPPGTAPGAVLIADRAAVQLNPAVVTTDVAAFEAALAAAQARAQLSGEERQQRLTEAVRLYRGELLPGYFDSWTLQERQRLAEAHLQALRQLAALLEAAGDLSLGIEYVRRALGADPRSEELREELIRLLAAAGDSEAARRHYQELERVLEQEYGVDPDPELRELIRSVGRRPGRHPAPEPAVAPARPRPAGRRGPRPPRRPAVAPHHSPPSTGPAAGGPLPRSLTRFFGREEEIAALDELLGRIHQGDPLQALVPAPAGDLPGESGLSPAIFRLVTLTGPGGCGKTRLAMEVGGRVRERFQDAVWFVPLQELTDPRLILDQLQTALSPPRTPRGEPLEQVVAFLSRRPSLLLLDNFEHLAGEGAVLIRRLLERVESLVMLVTSRHRLNLTAEREFPVAPLPVPVDSSELRIERPPNAAHSGPSTLNCHVSTLTRCPSVALFLDRARAARPEFPLTPATIAAVADLCRHLEGLPLAIELAAARAAVLTPQQMLSRLQAPDPPPDTPRAPRLELLAGRRRDLTERHRSLRAALEWSYRLLSPELRQFFARLAVFRGGFTLDAAEGVCGEEGVGCWVFGAGATSTVRTPNTQHSTPALDCLEELRDSSLVLAEPGVVEGRLRFRMLETLREYAAEQLTAGELAALRHRHAAYYMALAETAEGHLEGPDQLEWLARLEREHDNLRAALAWCLEDSGHRASGAGEGPLVLVDDRGPAAGSAAKIGLRLGGALGGFWRARCHVAEGREWLAQLLALPGAAAATVARAQALRWAGVLAQDLSDKEAARSCFQESLAIYRQHGDLQAVAAALIGLGAAAEGQDDYDTARPCYEESLALSCRLGSKLGMANALSHLAEVAREEGNLATAVARARQSLALQEEIGNGRGVVEARNRLSIMLHHQGDHAAALSVITESLEEARELGDKRDIAWGLICLGDVSRCLGDYEAAAGAYREGLDLWREIGDEWSVAGMLDNLGHVARHRGAYTEAMRRFRECIGRYQALAQEQAATRAGQGLAERFTAVCLVGIAGVAAGVGQPERAGRLLGAADAALTGVGARLWPAERAEYRRTLQAVRAQLDEAAFAAAWAEGLTLPLDQALADALTLATAPAD